MLMNSTVIKCEVSNW